MRARIFKYSLISILYICLLVSIANIYIKSIFLRGMILGADISVMYVFLFNHIAYEYKTNRILKDLQKISGESKNNERE